MLFTGQRQDYDHYGQQGRGGYRRGRGGGGYNDGYQQQGRYGGDRGYGGGSSNRNYGGQDYGYNRGYGGGGGSSRNRDYGRDRYPSQEQEFKESTPGKVKFLLIDIVWLMQFKLRLERTLLTTSVILS